jgi:NAD-dependent DNA ligase
MTPNLKAPLTVRKKLFLRAREFYYEDPNGKTLMSDEDFDALEDSIKEEDPHWIGLKKTGTKVAKKTKTKLEVPMPSLNKATPENIQNWLDKFSSEKLFVSEKVDGTALQIAYDGGVPVNCTTRGDGVTGGDVSFLLPHMKIPKKISFKSRLILRCEGIFTKTVFKKYEKEFDSARSAASGIMNRQGDKIHPAIRDLNCVVLLVLNPWSVPSVGIKKAKQLGFTVIAHKVFSAGKVTSGLLSRVYAKRKTRSRYHIDGLAVTVDRKNSKPTGDKPSWAIAFKLAQTVEDAPTATVIKILWKVSAHGKLVPKVQIKPIMFEGVKVQFATANNAQWMIERKLGPGAVVKMIRGGEIIPKIIKVLKPGKVSLPPKTEFGPYGWDKGHTHLMLVNPSDNEDANIRRITRFFSHMKIDFIKEGTVRKLYEAGFTSIVSILKAEPKDLMKAEGIKDTGANKLYTAIQTLFTNGALMPMLMAASGKFPMGVGSKRIAQIQKIYPNLLELAQKTPNEVLNLVKDVPMFNTITAKMFVDGIYTFATFFKKSGIKIKKLSAAKTVSKKLSGVSVTFTGYRDKGQEAVVIENGGEIVSFGGSTNVLLVSPNGKFSSKPEKAKQKGIPVLEWTQFEKKYKL